MNYRYHHHYYYLASLAPIDLCKDSIYWLVICLESLCTQWVLKVTCYLLNHYGFHGGSIVFTYLNSCDSE